MVGCSPTVLRPYSMLFDWLVDNPKNPSANRVRVSQPLWCFDASCLTLFSGCQKAILSKSSLQRICKDLRTTFQVASCVQTVRIRISFVCLWGPPSMHKSTWIEVNLFSRALDAWWDDPEVLMGALTNQNFVVEFVWAPPWSSDKHAGEYLWMFWTCWRMNLIDNQCASWETNGYHWNVPKRW